MYVFFIFHIRRLLRTQLAWVLACCCALVVALVLGSVWVWKVQQLTQLRKEIASVKTALDTRQRENQEAQARLSAPITLQRFESGRVVAALNKLAQAHDLALSEVNYTLEDSSNLPYLRYRIQFSIISRYPQFRKFLLALPTDYEVMSLDGFSCSREDISAIDLNCDVTFTAFFSRGDRG